MVGTKNFLASIVLALTVNLCAADLSCNTFNPENTAIIIDFHDVVTNSWSLKHGVHAARNLGLKGTLYALSRIVKGQVHNKVISKLTKKPQRAIESFVLEGCDSATNTELDYCNVVLELINPHTINPDGLALLKELKAKGYDLYGCSNLGKKSYKYMRKNYPEAFEHFTYFRYSGGKNGDQKKSEPSVYRDLLTKIDAKKPSEKKYEQFVFVDDKQSNLEIAQRVFEAEKRPLLGVLCKSSSGLRAQFEKAGILAPQLD